METGKMINMISNRLRRRSMAVQESVGISGSQGNILDYILVEGMKRKVYQKDIEREFGLRPPTASEVLKALEKRELICRVPDEEDGRWKRIVFTKKAEKIHEALRREIEESEALLLRGISREEQETFLEIAGKMLKNLDEHYR
ncbi:MarR family transcriptional regulator [Faecalicatena contorta]|uniref:MarR family transcriptional regulator n=1 Tax=Faecalicatena fissicatena TaxID=290055 RepID=A0ABS2E6N0_9FIRM|nr:MULTISPECIES: MarR family transcriptional regulator [Clostridia]MBM6685259.1 MarR family transcriptional regulator [Faecalicatena contorta]MBM6710804.1 MarR family transcriptional regulator [Faecalicatena contorta]MBM6737264.1 MarR family transcriptional regulator [Faecalicatena fissicatena]HIX98958.1 MarR family transcriptional regulator [Candidatus Dorea intestinigallinarum]